VGGGDRCAERHFERSHRVVTHGHTSHHAGGGYTERTSYEHQKKIPREHLAQDLNLIVIAAQLTGALYREYGTVADPEFLCDLLIRFHLSLPSVTTPS